MKHQIKKIKFAHSKSQRVAIIKNLARDLIIHGHLKTTKAKSKVIVPYMEKMITYAKQNENAQKFLYTKVADNYAVEKLVEITKQRFSTQSSGFVSAYNLGNRKGDGAEICMVVLSGYQPKVKTNLKKVSKTVEPKTKNEDKPKVKKSEVKEVKVVAKQTKEASK